MKLLVLLVGMVLIIEGIPYVAAPESMKGWLKKLSELPASQLRSVGLFIIGVGLIIIWVAQRSALFTS